MGENGTELVGDMRMSDGLTESTFNAAAELDLDIGISSGNEVTRGSAGGDTSDSATDIDVNSGSGSLNLTDFDGVSSTVSKRAGASFAGLTGDARSAFASCTADEPTSLATTRPAATAATAADDTGVVGDVGCCC
jgi:hypothetical protein